MHCYDEYVNLIPVSDILKSNAEQEKDDIS